MSRDNWQDPGFAANWDEAGNLLTNPDRLQQLSLLADLLAAGDCRYLLDLGIGSAQVEAAIQRYHPRFFESCRVTGIDSSEAMLELARARCASDGLDRVDLLQGDFGALDDIAVAGTPDAVICAQALHEVPHETKRAVFAWVRRRLPEGRPFYVLDRFAYADGAWLDDWRATWNWMRGKLEQDVLGFDEYHRQYRAKADHIATLDEYRGWLEDAGFETICPYRCFNRALIVARA